MRLGLTQRVAAAAGGICLRLAAVAANTLATAVRLPLSGWRSGDGPWLRAPPAATVGQASVRRPFPSCLRIDMFAAVFICVVYPQGIFFRRAKECTMLQSQRQSPKLLEQVRTAIRTRHYSLRTQETYLSWI
jgi:hypothetical protein